MGSAAAGVAGSGGLPVAQRGLPGATGAGADGGAAGDHGEGAVARRQSWKPGKNP